MQNIFIYTDGSSKGNPGPGGFGSIMLDDDKVKETGGREDKTTNNRMEMRAVIEALHSTPLGAHIEVHADSEYVIKGVTEWAPNWQKNGWRTKNKKEVLNQDLWKELLTEVEKRNVYWQKVLGHSGHKYNERCDFIATSFADDKKIKLFQGDNSEYEKFLETGI